MFWLCAPLLLVPESYVVRVGFENGPCAFDDSTSKPTRSGSSNEAGLVHEPRRLAIRNAGEFDLVIPERHCHPWRALVTENRC